MKIALIETDLTWENIDENLSRFESILRHVDDDCDFAVLPEMFSSGFTMNPSIFTDEDLRRIPVWMKNMANQYGMALAGSSIAPGNNGYYNRFYFVFPHGEVDFYDKRHLFRMGEEQNHYLAGSARRVFHYLNWRILPQVCYDLRFPVWSRCRNDYELLVYVANWPAVRQDVWTTLLKARAIENQCYVVGVNRSGSDPQVAYSGGSVVFSPKGEVLSEKSIRHYSIIYANIDMQILSAFREKFPAWRDADDFSMPD
jgi:omega-amidase